MVRGAELRGGRSSSTRACRSSCCASSPGWLARVHLPDPRRPASSTCPPRARRSWSATTSASPMRSCCRRPCTGRCASSWRRRSSAPGRSSVVFRGMKAIPIALAPARISRSREARLRGGASPSSKAGELVCIFPEGRLTADGEVGEFRPGLMRVAARSARCRSCRWRCRDCGARRSRAATTGLGRYLPRRLWSRIDVAVGAPLAAAA